MSALSAHPTCLKSMRHLETRTDAEMFRCELVAQADTIRNLVAEVTHRPTPERVTQCAMHLDGIRMLLMRYRAALIIEIEGAKRHES